MRAMTVYCSSSTQLDQQFHDVARAVGEELGRRGLRLIYGGGSLGLMGELARAAQAAGGTVTGVITRSLADKERAHAGCEELIVVETLRERKKIMAERGDGFLVLPGGIGTYEEFFEILVGRQLGEHDKPIGIVNSHGYYNPLIAMVEHGIEHCFIQRGMYELFHIDPDPGKVIEAVIGAGPSSAQAEEVSVTRRAAMR